MLGVLISNLGTPDSYQVKDVRKFLKEFLWDPRVVKMSRLVWWAVLHGIILNTRPQKSAAAYKKIWTDTGSPLLSITKNQCASLKNSIANTNSEVLVEIGMRYGNPSIESGLRKLKVAGAERFLVLPLYPQFSYTTTASVEDRLMGIVNAMRLTDYKIAPSYFDRHEYISALTDSVKTFWASNGKAKMLLVSFHGIPQEYSDDGDPYQHQCHTTANLLAESLRLEKNQWMVSFQSRLGPKKWLEPYTDKTLEYLAKSGINSVQIICPGFSADCLETLEEVAIENRKIFINAGGKKYSYIPCLNNSEKHINMMTNLILENDK